MSYSVSDIMPLKVGTKWVYRAEYKIFGRDLEMQVVDKKNDYYLVRFKLNNNRWSVVLKSNVDLFLTGYSKIGIGSFNEPSDLVSLPKSLLLKSPVIEGNTWENDYGQFTIVSTDHRLKIGEKIATNCVHVHLKDASNEDNDIYVKEGIGLIFATVHIDNYGKINLSLKKFN